MAPTPGGGPSLLRLAAVNTCALGFGLTDGVFFIFMISTLMYAGASSMLAFVSLAGGGALAMIFAPMASAGSTSPNRRATITFTMLLTGAACCIGIAIVFSSFVIIPKWKAYFGVALAALYRACVQASPVVPCVMDAALTRGDEANYPQRRDISLSFYYLEYRLGLLVSSLTVALLPRRMLDLFPIMATFAGISFALTVLATISFPYELPIPKQDDDAEWDDIIPYNESFTTIDSEECPDTQVKEKQQLQPFKSRVVEHMNAALFQADRRLLAGYVELVYYGIAFGQLYAIIPCFFNDVVFRNSPGDMQGTVWASYVAIVGIGLGMLFDASLPSLVFREGAKKFTMTVAWALGAFFGSALFFALMFVTSKWPAMIIFCALYLSTSTHNLFSLLCAGSLVRPMYRGTSFSVRAGALNLGILVGTLLAGFISGTDGWKWVMFHSSNACFASGLAAAFAGSVKREDYAGVAANSNALWKYLATKAQKNIDSLRSRIVV